MGSNIPRLTFSVDLELEIEQQGDELEQRLESLTSRLVDLFESFSIPATWAVADPAVSAATPVIRSRPLRHELAILGDQTWVGLGADQNRFARELTRRLLSARHAGIEIETLALRHVELYNELELLIRAGIRVVRNGQPQSDHSAMAPQRNGMGPEMIEAPVALRFPSTGRWWRWQTFLAKRVIRRTSSETNACHVVIDCAKLIVADEAGLRDVKSLLTFASKLRDQRQLAICTLSKMAPRRFDSPAPTPAHSVLRPAA